MHPISPPAYQPACLVGRWTLHHLGQITSLEIIHHFRGKVLNVCPQHEHRIPQPINGDQAGAGRTCEFFSVKKKTANIYDTSPVTF